MEQFFQDHANDKVDFSQVSGTERLKQIIKAVNAKGLPYNDVGDDIIVKMGPYAFDDNPMLILDIRAQHRTPTGITHDVPVLGVLEAKDYLTDYRDCYKDLKLPAYQCPKEIISEGDCGRFVCYEMATWALSVLRNN